MKTLGQFVLQGAGQCVEYIEAPVKRTEALIRNGMLDGDLMRTKIWADQNVDTVVYVPTPLYQDEIVAVFVKPLSQSLGSLNDLRSKRVVITSGHRWAEAQLMQRGITPVMASTYGHFMEHIHFGKVDVGLIEKSSLPMLGEEPNVMTKVISPIQFHIVLRKEHEDLVPSLDTALKRIKAQFGLMQN
ncbi:MAG: hypothetical protein JJ850_14845 [Kordiimonadaceae bacterium]|nr:hypothetical protein [Kordiimonadaceae bacterium]MBO6570006.1 hypothetical protein [Kordiimonadaceae bacterium]MBO6965897.1 hypothetical protein [Kordiimonadaceae bacterium]